MTENRHHLHRGFNSKARICGLKAAHGLISKYGLFLPLSLGDHSGHNLFHGKNLSQLFIACACFFCLDRSSTNQDSRQEYKRVDHFEG